MPQSTADVRSVVRAIDASPIAGRIEVRQPCPHCRDHQMIPRTQYAEHLARLHPEPPQRAT